MFEKFSIWYRAHSTEITWFVIGWLVMATVEAAGRGHYVIAVVDLGLAYFNYHIWKGNNNV